MACFSGTLPALLMGKRDEPMKSVMKKIRIIFLVLNLFSATAYANSNSDNIGLDQEAFLYAAYHSGMMPISQIEMPENSEGFLGEIKTIGRVLSGNEKFRFFQDGDYLTCKVDIDRSMNIKKPFNDGKVTVRIHDCDAGAKISLKGTMLNSKGKIVHKQSSEIVAHFDSEVAHAWYRNLNQIDTSGLVATQTVKTDGNRAPAIIRVLTGQSVAGNIE